MSFRDFGPRFLRVLQRRDDDLRDRFQSALAERYRIRRELGRGNMGIVYLAHDPRLDRPVAIKLFPPELMADRVLGAQFLHEARIAARLSHPNIVPIYSVEHAAEFLFFTMAYVEGETLGDRLRRKQKLPLPEVTRIVRDVALAASYAHTRRVIHRDLKPDNILLERDTDRVLVTDFGIAFLRRSNQPPPAGEFVGTPEYMSPEQTRAEPADERSDIYALGVMAHHAASGKLPFQGTLPQVLDQQRNVVAPPLKYGNHQDQTLARCVELCLEKEPAKRFQTAAELVAALEQSVELRRYLRPLQRQFVRQVTRNGTALVLILVLIGAVPLGACLLSLSRGLWAEAFSYGLLFAVIACSPVAALFPTLRRAARAGELNNLVPALVVDRQHEHEEAQDPDGSYLGKLSFAALVARRTTWAAVAILGVGVLMLTSGIDLSENLAMGVTAFGGYLLIVAGLTSGILNDKSDETVSDWWLTFWTSRLGEWTMKLASLGVAKRWDSRKALVGEPVIMTEEEADRIWKWAEGQGD